MKKLLLASAILCLIFSACGSGSGSSDDTFFYVTRLGNDTLAIERVKTEGKQLIADVVLRSPRISLTSYQLEFDELGHLSSMYAATFKEKFSGFGIAQGTLSQILKVEGDSMKIEYEGRNGTVSSSILNDKNFLPFIDMVHWPYDIAFNWAHESKSDSIHQYLISGSRASDFIIHNTADNEYTLRHPSRGVMYVQTNSQGDMVWLDAKETTRKLIVERVKKLDFDKLTARYLEIDKQGSPFGTLSPAEENSTSFGGSDFKVTFGSPQKRGRSIFGGIVPYGEVWRTGANTASHFSTTKDIYISGNKVPAGEYTLFSIPEENDGTLIINKQTGQNGQAYNQEQDLMRVPMMRENNDEEVEGFTIQVVKTDSGGSIELLWDKTIYYVDFNFQ